MSHQYVESGSGFCAKCDDMPGEGEHAVKNKDDGPKPDYTIPVSLTRPR